MIKASTYFCKLTFTWSWTSMQHIQAGRHSCVKYFTAIQMYTKNVSSGVSPRFCHVRHAISWTFPFKLKTLWKNKAAQWMWLLLVYYLLCKHRGVYLLLRMNKWANCWVWRFPSGRQIGRRRRLGCDKGTEKWIICLRNEKMFWNCLTRNKTVKDIKRFNVTLCCCCCCCFNHAFVY